MQQSFKKIRIKPAKDTHIDRLFRKQKDMKNKSDKESKVKLKQVEYELADQMAGDLYNIVKEEVKIVKSDEGGFSCGHLWKIKNKLRPKHISNPTAMLNREGKLVTESEDKKEATMEHFKHVLRNRHIIPNLQRGKRKTL